MTTGELLVALFEAYRNNDDSAFMKAGMTLIEEEKAKNHYVLANKLKKTLSSVPEVNYNKSSFTNKLNRVMDLPKDKDDGTELVKIIYPQKNFNDIVLPEEIKKQLDNVIVEYEKKEILKAYGLVPKKKLLFCGPPGCGKTICAEAVANALDLPILYVCFDGLISSYLGETSSNIRKVFDYASKNNWVLFFDEFDAIGKSRDTVEEHLLNQNAKDQAILADKLGLSEKQLSHVTNSEPGSGLILFDNVVIPFVDKYPTNTKTYAIMNTKPEEAVKKDEAS